jgi:FKBP-type peptidyl-prolyl cis-trans isomerase FkpA
VFRTRLASVFALSLLLSACSADSLPTGPDIASATFATALGVNIPASTKTATGLYYRDIAAGSGATVVSGQKLIVRYTGWLINGTQFDSNQTGYAFTIGTGAVITGWDQGIVGMKVGGTRQLIIPPSLAYGATANNSIPGYSILVFNVTVISAQ